MSRCLFSIKATTSATNEIKRNNTRHTDTDTDTETGLFSPSLPQVGLMAFQGHTEKRRVICRSCHAYRRSETSSLNPLRTPVSGFTS